MNGRHEQDVLISVLAQTYNKVFLLDKKAGCGYVLKGNHRSEVTDFDLWCREYYEKRYAGDDIGLFFKNLKSDKILSALTYEDTYETEYPIYEEGEVRRKHIKAFWADVDTICVCESDVTKQFRRESNRNMLMDECLELAQRASMDKAKTWNHLNEEIRLPFYEAYEMLNKALEDEAGQKEYIQKAKCVLEKHREMFEQMFTLSAIEKGEELEEADLILPEKLLEILRQMMETKMENTDVTWKISNLSPQISAFISDKARLCQLLYNAMSAVAEVSEDKMPEAVLDFDIMEAVGDIDDDSDEIPVPGVFDLRFRIYAKAEQERICSAERMSYVFQLTDFMNAVISFEEKQDGRTEMKVVVPVQEAEKNEETEAGIVSHLADNIHNKDFTMYRALVVDDDEISREIMVSKLKQFGLKVDTAGDGQEAIDMLVASKEEYYRIMFMKMMLPKKSGLEATMELREMDRIDLNDITIVAYTANELRDKRLRALEHGMDHHLVLPFNDIGIREILVRELQDIGPRDDHEKFGFRVLK